MTTQTLPIHLERWHEDVERYDFDFKRCHFRDGWAQIDTDQDASYFGQWANPLELRILTFAEGDCCLAIASNPAEFVAEIRRMQAWHAEQGFTFHVDGMCQDRIIAAFTAMGLDDLLH